MTVTLTSTTTVAVGREATAQSVSAASADHDALGPGTRLDEFEIVRVLGVGGFGIVYLALDQVLLRHVAIKEYMPCALAGRGEGALVRTRSTALAETFALGLESFLDEARMLASFDQPSLVRVHRFWKANGTAYMVMPYYPGVTLKQARRGMKASPDESWLRAFVEPLLDALEILHHEGIYHRDITPDNILLLPDGRAVLLDFGAARRVVGDRTQSLTAVLKPNFAPIEQYADAAGMRQGPWTDLYALGATVRFMLTGEAPTPAVLRAVRDAMPPLAAAGGKSFPGVPTGFLATIDWTLALAPGDRPQSVASARRAFNGEIEPPPQSRPAIELRLPCKEADDDPAAVEVVRLDTAAQADPGAEVHPLGLPAVPEATPARRRDRRRGTLAVLALTGLGVLGWSGQTSSPSRPVSSEATIAAAPVVSAVALPQATALPGPAAPPRAAPRRTVPSHAVAAGNARPKAATAAKPAPPGIALAATPPAYAADAGPASPKAACGDINFFALAVCVGRECQTPRWRTHPQCVELRDTDEQRQRRMDQQ